MPTRPHPIVRPALVLLVALLSIVGASAARAQSRQFDGENGYADLVAAAELVRKSRPYRAVATAEAKDPDGATLEQKRLAAADPTVLRVLALLRRGLSKPVVAAPPTASVLTSGDRFPQDARFRETARLLMMVEYVDLADGNVPAALDTLALGLRFGGALHGDTLISGLVAIAVEAIVVSPIGRHLEQLSAPDCERLFELCQDWLRQPTPLPGVLQGERRLQKDELALIASGVQKDPKGALESRFFGPNDPEEDSAEARQSRQLLADLQKQYGHSGDAYAPLFRDVEKHIDDHFDSLRRELAKPAWEQTRIDPAADGSLAGRFIAQLGLGVFQLSGEKYAGREARIRLLAVHAAVLRYRWEHDRLPVSLEDLHLGELLTDPFTGQPLKYEAQGKRYRLWSLGPLADADDPKAVDGRRPLTLTPDGS